MMNPRKHKGQKRYNHSSQAETIRLNKYIANSGLCSRREADQLILSGKIQVNGQVVRELGTKVNPEDKVSYKGRLLNDEKPVYVLLNKPKDYVTTVKDAHAQKTVMDLVEKACTERIYPVGRLDRNTTGVLLLTNDGELAKRLMHPRYKKKKVYHVVLDKPVTKNHLELLVSGVNIGDEIVAADAVSYVDQQDKTQIGVEIHTGQNRVIRRMFESLGYHIRKLDRVYFAGLTKKNLKRGHWRFLSQNEINKLKMNAFQ
jgi:23S rRNA pseudouridine2605 synthase